MKKSWIIVILLVVLIGGGFFIARQRRAAEPAQAIRQNLMQSAMPVERGDITREIGASGTIVGARQAELGFTTGGRLQEVFVEVGQYVEAGQVLAKMESSQQELALLRAQNAFELAKISGTPNSLREAELDLKVAEANLENTTIKAPFAGIVTGVQFEAGEHVSANNAVVSLLDNSVFYAEIAVDELDMHQVKLGQIARVEVDALGKQPLWGTVSSIGLIAQSSGGITTVPVTIRIEDGSENLRVGYSASVVIEVERAENVLKVPVEAVVRRGNKSFVTVVRAGETRQVEVTTGITDGIAVEITSGLEPNDQIVGFNISLYGSTRSQSTGVRVGGLRIGGFGR